MESKGKGDSGGNGGIRISTSDFEKRLKVIDVEISVKLIKKCTMLGPANIFKRKVFEMQRRGNQTDLGSLTSLGKYFLLPGAREELKKAANLAFRPHRLRFPPCVVNSLHSYVLYCIMMKKIK